MSLQRRHLLGMMGSLPTGWLVTTGTTGAPDAHTFALHWAEYRSRFVRDDGRVVDTGNGGISHSEGQGYGMLFAVAAGDRDTLDRLHGWLQSHLQVRPSDRLHAWRFDPEAMAKVPDLNNATDGDLLIALALARAAARWPASIYQEDAAAILRDVLALCTATTHRWQRVLLPGAGGFSHADGLVLNPSYAIFPALQAAASLGTMAGEPAQWDRLVESSMALIAAACFGRFGLPPDWLHVGNGGQLTVANGWPPRFSYDAIRVPLHLLWGGLLDSRQASRFADYWNTYGAALPAWVDLETDAVAPYRASIGMRAVAAATGFVAPPRPTAEPVSAVLLAEDYYSASLALLAGMVEMETER